MTKIKKSLVVLGSMTPLITPIVAISCYKPNVKEDKEKQTKIIEEIKKEVRADIEKHFNNKKLILPTLIEAYNPKNLEKSIINNKNFKKIIIKDLVVILNDQKGKIEYSYQILSPLNKEISKVNEEIEGFKKLDDVVLDKQLKLNKLLSDFNLSIIDKSKTLEYFNKTQKEYLLNDIKNKLELSNPLITFEEIKWNIDINNGKLKLSFKLATKITKENETFIQQSLSEIILEITGFQKKTKPAPQPEDPKLEENNLTEEQFEKKFDETIEHLKSIINAELEKLYNLKLKPTQNLNKKEEIKTSLESKLPKFIKINNIDLETDDIAGTMVTKITFKAELKNNNDEVLKTLDWKIEVNTTKFKKATKEELQKELNDLLESVNKESIKEKLGFNTNKTIEENKEIFDSIIKFKFLLVEKMKLNDFIKPKDLKVLFQKSFGIIQIQLTLKRPFSSSDDEISTNTKIIIIKFKKER